MALSAWGIRGTTVTEGRAHARIGLPGPLFYWGGVGAPAALDVLEGLAEALGHGLAVHLERAGDAAEHRGGSVILGGAEEAGLAEGLEDRFHLARHVHLEHQRLGRNSRVARDLEGHHDRHAEHRAHRLLDEEIEGALDLGRHLDRARAEHAHAVAEPQHALLGPPAAVGLHPHAGPEAWAREVPLLRGSSR